MFERLKNKWKVNNVQLILVLCTFAMGGSLCGYAGRFLLSQTPLEKNALWYVLYILLVTLLWPFCVLLISIPLGQFRFFRSYIGKLLARVGIGKKP